MIWQMAMEYFNIMKDRFIRVSEKMIFKMDMGKRYGLITQFMKDSFLMGKKEVKVH